MSCYGLILEFGTVKVVKVLKEIVTINLLIIHYLCESIVKDIVYQVI